MNDLITHALTYLLFAAFGLAGAWRGWRQLGRARASIAWPRANGRIAGSEEQVMHNGEYETRRGVITYDYAVAGVTYRGHRVLFGDGIALVSDKPRRQRLAVYPVGQPVLVAYDPAAPRDAVLEPGVSWPTYLDVVGPLALAIFGLLGLIF